MNIFAASALAGRLPLSSLFFFNGEERQGENIGGEHLGSHPRQPAYVGPAAGGIVAADDRPFFITPCRVFSLLRLQFSVFTGKSSTRVMISQTQPGVRRARASLDILTISIMHLLHFH